MRNKVCTFGKPVTGNDILDILDFFALAYFFVMWIGYSILSAWLRTKRLSLHQTLSIIRYDWMYQMLFREQRMHDVGLVGIYERNCMFFASSSLLIIAGLLSLIGYMPSMQSVLQIAHLHITQEKFFMATLLLVMIFVFAFFIFTWAMRQFGFVGTLLVSAPMPHARTYNAMQRKEFAEHCSAVANLASGHFNHGLRSYYFALAVLGWYVHPVVFVCLTSVVVAILYQREFHSRALYALQRSLVDIEPASYK